MAVYQAPVVSARQTLRLACYLFLATAVFFSTRPAAAATAEGAVQAVCHDQLTRSEDALRSRQFSVAIEAAEAARGVCSDKAGPLMLLARGQMLNRQFEEALKSLKLLLDADTGNASALILKGQVLYLENHDADASRAFEAAVNVAPNQAEPYYWLGKFLYETAKPRQAILQFEAAIHADPTFYRAYDGLGLAYAAVNENDRAVENFFQAVKLTRQEPRGYDEAYGDLSELLLRLGKTSLAFDVAVEAADRNPGRSRNFYLAGRAAQESEQYEASLRWLKRAVELDADFPDPHYQLARVYRHLRQNDAASAEVAIYRDLAAKAPKVRR